MSDFGVLDDEMPDSFPPDDEGPDPYEGQDLDSLLSGENCYVPETLRPVIPTLDALRAAPMHAELRGEAEARAYFRTIMRDGGSESARPEAGADEARTLTPPTVTPHGERHVARRPHRHRRQLQRGHWRAKALAGVAAAAVVIVGAVALANTFSNSGGHPAATGRSPQATNAATGATAHGTNAVEGTGNASRAAVTPTVAPSKTSKRSGNSASPEELCREFFGFFAHPGQHASPDKILQQLSSFARGSHAVRYYCLRLLEPWAMTEDPGKLPPILGYRFSGGWQSPEGGQNFQGFQGAGPSPNPSSSGNDGNGGNGNGSGSSNQ